MNQEIFKNLYKEATGVVWRYDFDILVAEHFAELVVEECCNQIRAFDAHQIQQHFKEPQ